MGFILLLSLAVPLLIYHIEDYIFYRLFIISSAQSTFYRAVNLILPLSFAVFILAYICDHRDLAFFFVSFSFLLFLLQQKKHLISNSLESRYAALSLFLLIPFSQEQWVAAFFLSSNILVSSLTAGIAKLKDPLWNDPKSIALFKFFQLPWLVRPFLRNLLSRVFINTNHNISPWLILFSKIVPFMQIVTALGLLILIPAKIFLSVPIPFIWFLPLLAFQIFFPVLLFVIAGLGMIPLMYLINILMFVYSLIRINSINHYYSLILSSPLDLCMTLLSGFVFLLFLLGSFSILSKCPNELRWFSSLFDPLIPSGLAYMFTDINMQGMIIPYYCPNRLLSSKQMHGLSFNPLFFINAFNKDGTKSFAQSFSSTKFFCLYYSLMDFFLLNYYRKLNSVDSSDSSIYYGTTFRMNVLDNLTRYLRSGRIFFTQYVWDDKSNSYIGNFVGCYYFHSLGGSFVFESRVSNHPRTNRLGIKTF